MRFGASVWPWKWDEPYDGAIKRIGRAGFRATELIAWDDDSFADYYTGQTVRELRKILDDEGMPLSQFVVKTPDLSSPDPRRRAATVELFKRGVEKTVALGSPIINTVVHHPFALSFPELMDRPHMQTFTQEVPGDLDWAQNWDDYEAALRECAKAAEDGGIKYSLEPHLFRYGANVEGLLRILEAVGSPALGVNLDPATSSRSAICPTSWSTASAAGCCTAISRTTTVRRMPTGARAWERSTGGLSWARWPTPGSTASSRWNSRTFPEFAGHPGRSWRLPRQRRGDTRVRGRVPDRAGLPDRARGRSRAAG